MKKLVYPVFLISLSILFFHSCKTIGTLEKQGIKLVEGSDLYYTVNMNGSEYPFDINMNGFTDDYISFDWDMGVRNSGTVSIDKESLDSATALYNYFSAGYVHLENKTSVWISKQLFNNLQSGKSAEIDLGNGDKTIFKKTGSEIYCLPETEDQTEKCIKVIIIKDANNTKEIWIANDPQNRLIVMMDIGFRIDLIKIES